MVSPNWREHARAAHRNAPDADFEKENPPRVSRVMRSKRDCFLVSVWKE